MENKKGITVRDVIKKITNNGETPYIELFFGHIGIMGIEIHLSHEENKKVCFSPGIGKDNLERLLNAKVEKTEFEPGIMNSGVYTTGGHLKIVIAQEETEFVEI